MRSIWPRVAHRVSDTHVPKYASNTTEKKERQIQKKHTHTEIRHVAHAFSYFCGTCWFESTRPTGPHRVVLFITNTQYTRSDHMEQVFRSIGHIPYRIFARKTKTPTHQRARPNVHACLRAAGIVTQLVFALFVTIDKWKKKRTRTLALMAFFPVVS